MTRAACVLPCALALAGCVPWTVRPIETSSAESGPSSLTPAAFVESMWEGKLRPAVAAAAVDARALIDALRASPEEAVKRYGRGEPDPAWFVVKGRGVVVRVDTSSRVGLAFVDVHPPDGAADLTVQLGPVLRGTSLRDAPEVVRFSDFVNQIQFAGVANELNARVLKEVLDPLDKSALHGCTVSFTGTLAVARDLPLREMIPVDLVVEGCR